MSHALLTPTRGDRKTMLTHCLKQVSRFTASVDAHLIIDFKPENQKKDLKHRVKAGYEEALKLGVDWIVIIEDDDHYDKEYLHKVLMLADKSDFIGCEYSFYYNLKNRTWEKILHAGRSSLYTTAFRVSAMKNFAWHRADDVFLDLNIWQYAKRFRRSFVDAGAIGIKGHGFGLSGGKGHQLVMKNKDPELTWLESKVDSDSFEFYKTLKV
jgi:hypothetical protein